jgi:hypothetical protein
MNTAHNIKSKFAANFLLGQNGNKRKWTLRLVESEMFGFTFGIIEILGQIWDVLKVVKRGFL